jgi:dihydropteroate synthase
MQPHFNPRLLQPASAAELEAEIERIESYAEAIPRLLARASWLIVRLDDVPAHGAMLVKQLVVGLDGDALISPEVYLGQPGAKRTPMLIFGTRRLYQALIDTLRLMPLPALQQLAQELAALLAAGDARGRLQLGARSLAWGERTYIMGIVNVTPDSFSRDGLLEHDDVVAAAVEQARRFEAEGADLLDIGGESTRPGARPVGVEQELARVLPPLQALRAACALPISVDTYKAEVAAAALDAGAELINDIWGLRTPEGGWNEPLARLVAERQAPIVLMHNRRAADGAVAAAPGQGGHYRAVEYDDLLGELCADLRASVAYARSCGVPDERIILDPGLGFGKTPAQNIVLLRRLAELRSLGLPILLGASRKSFIGLALELPPEQRGVGTLATTALGIQAGADIVRVHDVALNVQVARMSDAILRPGAWERLTSS